MACSSINTAEEDKEASKRKQVTIAIVGKPGAGKSCLMYNILNEEVPISYSASPETKEPKLEEKYYEDNNTNVTVVDTVGLYGVKNKEKRKTLEQLSKFKKDVHLIIFCFAATGSRFQDGNPEIMKVMQDVFGERIWRHCIVVISFCNFAQMHMEKSHKEDVKQDKYKSLIEDYVEQFRKELTKRTQNIEVQSFFQWQQYVSSPSPTCALSLINSPDSDAHSQVSEPTSSKSPTTDFHSESPPTQPLRPSTLPSESFSKSPSKSPPSPGSHFPMKTKGPPSSLSSPVSPSSSSAPSSLSSPVSPTPSSASLSSPPSSTLSSPVSPLPSPQKGIIVAIPAGFSPHDNVLLRSDVLWNHVIFEQAVTVAPEEQGIALLQYRYGRELLKRALNAVFGKASPVNLYNKIQELLKQSKKYESKESSL